MVASQVVAVPSWLEVKRASVAPQEHRVDHRSGRSFETCEISLRPRGSARKGEFALLSLRPENVNDYGHYHASSVLDRTGRGLQANIVQNYVLLSAVLHVAVVLKSTSGRLLVPTSWRSTCS